MEMLRDILTLKMAAEMLDVTGPAVQKAIEDGRLAATKMGGAYLLERSEVERYRRERKLTGPRKVRPRSLATAS